MADSDRGAASPWSSEESREFLQKRIATYARLVFFISAGFYVAGWVVSAITPAMPVGAGAPLQPASLFHLASASVFLAMWLSTRGSPLPPTVLRAIDSVGTVLASWLMIALEAHMPIVLRPDLMAISALLAALLYRAAIVPSEVKRSAWIGALAAAPLPFVTYFLYTHSTLPAGAAPPAVYTVFSVFWSALVVLIPGVASRVIYDLRQTVREARRLGQYTLVEKIGEGGMGVVYRATHALLRRPTAIKLLPPERAGQIDLARFEREVQLTSLLTSPNTVAIYDYGRTPDGIFYYAMEYLDGTDLENLVRHEGPLPAGRVVHILRQACGALEEAHRGGLIHRDVKPANILLSERGGTPDVVKVVDFGLVKDILGKKDAGVTIGNVVLGTPYYMAPETLSSPERVDARSDLYALGGVAYFLLTGKVVFEGTTAEVFGSHLHSRPVPPSERLGRPVPAKLEALVLAALAKDSLKRPESARAFREALDACDDVPAWTEREAAAWWRDRGAKLKRSGAAPAAASPSESRTLVIDLAEKR